MGKTCSHLDLIQALEPGPPYCETCRATGGDWNELRMCLICGYVGCCDSSPSQHARRHFESTGHPVFQAHCSGEDWAWCYADEVYLEPA